MRMTLSSKAKLVAIAAATIIAASVAAAFAAPVLQPGVTTPPHGDRGVCTNCHTYASPPPVVTPPPVTPPVVTPPPVDPPVVTPPPVNPPVVGDDGDDVNHDGVHENGDRDGDHNGDSVRAHSDNRDRHDTKPGRNSGGRKSRSHD